VSSLLHPVGPEPPVVYWRRRAAAVGGLILVIIVLVMIIRALAGGGEGNDNPATPPSVTSTVPATSEPAEPLSAECQAADLEIVSRSEDSYTSATPVVIRAEITNKGSQACTVVPNAQRVQLHVKSAQDQIFETAHCADQAVPPGPEATLTIAPGATEELSIDWDGQRSVDRCQPVPDYQQPRRAPGATYQAWVTINGAESDLTTFELLP